MIAKFSEAFRLLWRHLALFTAIILTVWLPGNILLNYVAYYVKGSGDAGFTGSMKMTMWIEGIFGPIYIGALVYALFQIKSGRSVTYREAIAIGFKKWGSLFAARFVAGLFIGLGFLALLIPGIVLLVRYSFLDEVVILEEGRIATNARSRSTALTVGKSWQIFWSAVLFFIFFSLLSFAIYLPLGFIDSLNIMPVEVVLDCILDLAYAVIQIVIFLFYWESTQNLRRVEQGAPPNGGPATPLGNPGVTEGPPSVS
jgi:hypothetical protein